MANPKHKLSSIPLDSVSDIFFGIPVKTLLRFRCLSKPVCSLIDSPNFIKFHLNYSISLRSQLSSIAKDLNLYSLDLNSFYNITPLHDHPQQNIREDTQEFGSCNSLLAPSKYSTLQLEIYSSYLLSVMALPEFVLESGVISVLPQPDYFYFEKEAVFDLAEVAGRFCLICKYDEGLLDVWMMNQYGVKESWFNLVFIDGSKTITSFSFLNPPSWEWGNGDDNFALEEKWNEKLVVELNTTDCRTIIEEKQQEDRKVVIDEKQLLKQEENKEQNRKKRSQILGRTAMSQVEILSSCHLSVSLVPSKERRVISSVDERNTSEMSKIPPDIITDILCKQPVKSVLRFRAISKACCSLIDGQDFVNMHLNHSLQTKSNLSLILKGLHLYTVEFDTLDTPLDLNHPLYIGGGTEVIGSCNGLIVLRNSEQDLALYNPLTRKLRRLPVCEIGLPSDSCSPGYVFYGFGHDPIKDDYKLLRMVQFKENDPDEIVSSSFGYEVKVYSLKTNSWRKISNLPKYLRYLFQFFYHLMFRRGYGVLASGSLHWVAPRRLELVDVPNLIVAFDLVKEEFRELSLPDYGDESDNINKNFQLDVGVLEGSLCVVCYRDQVYADVWMMTEYGVKESWTKLFTVKRPGTMNCLAFLRPLAYSKEGDKVLVEVNGEKLLWYDLEKKRLRSVRINGGPDSFGAEMCVGSLVPLNDGDGKIHGMKQTEKEEKKKITNKKSAKVEVFLNWSGMISCQKGLSWFCNHLRIGAPKVKEGQNIIFRGLMISIFSFAKFCIQLFLVAVFPSVLYAYT
ncbi:hypothetical protein Patl1_09773 [Pistacia atlantica]|uniref:Uncharacterized protein n=1 Tax=Pistacia atlantica TaxID=434234 RepID=A0ACC1A829_9ROSI|nr:hypothetical protein Patl1_09773 [Pistacia atlantica]